MCELFGFYASKEKRLQPYLREFFRHSVRHPNGWGLATFENGEPNVCTEMISAEVPSAVCRDSIGGFYGKCNLSPRKNKPNDKHYTRIIDSFNRIISD